MAWLLGFVFLIPHLILICSLGENHIRLSAFHSTFGEEVLLYVSDEIKGIVGKGAADEGQRAKFSEAT